MTRENLIRLYGVNEEKIIAIELSIEKETKQVQTDMNAQAIQSFLHFTEV